MPTVGNSLIFRYFELRGVKQILMYAHQYCLNESSLQGKRENVKSIKCHILPKSLIYRIIVVVVYSGQRLSHCIKSHNLAFTFFSFGALEINSSKDTPNLHQSRTFHCFFTQRYLHSTIVILFSH